MKDTFPKILTLVLSATITPNVFEYVCKFLQFCELIQLYKNLLNRLNIIYIVTEIKKPRFEELNFFVFSTIKVLAILKIMIFVDNIKRVSKMVIHL